MKKTILLLFAASSVAIAANDITNSITWTSDTTATIKPLSGDMSIAFLLNWDEINEDKKQTLFTAYGPGSITESDMYGVGMGIYYTTASGYDLNSIHVSESNVNYIIDPDGYTNITAVLNPKEYTSITSAVLVYTFDKNTQSNNMNGTFGGTLYLWLDSEETPLSIYAGYQSNTYVGSLKNLVFDEKRIDTQSIRLYDGVIEDSEELAKAIRASTIPEPTTATLSLLALAGLAARRRRR